MRLPNVPTPRDVLALIEQGGDTVERVLVALPRIVPMLDRAEELLTQIEGLVRRIEATRRSAAAVVTRVEEPLGRLNGLLDAVEQPLLTLRPTLEALAANTDRTDGVAVGRLIDRMPTLAERFEREALPVLDALRTVAPDMHDLLDASRQLNEMLGQVPGMGRIKKRLDEEESDA